jgi:VWFA-related protein
MIGGMMLRRHPYPILSTFLTLMISAFLFARTVAQGTIEVKLTHVEGQPAEGQVAYEVNAFVSVLDEMGNSLKTLGLEDFELYEDSKRVEPDSVDLVGDIPIALILVVDTSGSMRGEKIFAVREAAGQFLEYLQPDDHVALVEFNNDSQLIVKLTQDRETLGTAVSSLESKPFGATCLYDAAYKAVEHAATISEGRRLVVLLTDGMDDSGIPGQPCSTNTIEDVIDIASDSNLGVPIYTLGIGDYIDEHALKRLADRTGGSFLYAPVASDIKGIFEKVSDQLRYQYVITYESTASPGSHTLVISVDVEGVIDQDSRGFLLPELPPSIALIQPVEGQEILDETMVVATISGQSGLVNHVTFLVGEEVVGTDETSPYQLDLNVEGHEPGPLEILVRAEGPEGEILSQAMTTIIILPPPSATPPPTATVVPAAPVTTIEPSEEEMDDQESEFPFWIVGVALALVVVGGYLFLRRRKKRPSLVGRLESATFDGLFSGKVLATLEVISSDNELMVGRKINIEKTSTTIGRSAANDIILPDKPVSRYHVRLRYDEGKLSAQEVEVADEQGKLRRPTYGTYVNERRIGVDPIPLKDGDELRLGKRACLRVGLPQPVTGSDDRTIDIPIHLSSEEVSDSVEEDLDRTRDVGVDVGEEDAVPSTVIEKEPEETIKEGIDPDETREVREESDQENEV